MGMNNHRWSGWPGAYCLKCGCEDAVENALALGWYDPIKNTYDTPEHEEEVVATFVCSVSDIEWAEHLERQGKLHLWKNIEQLLNKHRLKEEAT